MVFTCPHCPTAQAYQERIKKLVTDYASKNVTLIAINPNHADAVRLDELAYSDLSDSFDEMKERATQTEIQLRLARRRPEAGDVAQAYGPVATPHVFIFDKARKLRFEGRIDDSERESTATKYDTRAGARRAAGRQGAAGHHHQGVRLLGEVGRQGARLRQLPEEMGGGAGDARESRCRHAQGHSREQGLGKDPLHQCVGHLVRPVHHRVRRAGGAQPALPHPRLRDGDHRGGVSGPGSRRCATSSTRSTRR